MPSRRFQNPTPFKVEFWLDHTGRGDDRKHRNRFYSSVEGMLRAGARWEAKGRDYWCRYWNGLHTWQSASRTKTGPAHMPEVLGRASELASVTPIGPAIEKKRGVRAARRTSMQVFSIFGICEAAAAETMLKDGRATRKIPVEEIPESALTNEFGHKALFAVMIPGEQVQTFKDLCKELRA